MKKDSEIGAVSPSKMELPTAVVDGNDIASYTNYQLGKLLTIVDGAIVDTIQREAVKSLVKEAVWGPASQFQNWIATPEQKEIPKPFFLVHIK